MKRTNLLTALLLTLSLVCAMTVTGYGNSDSFSGSCRYNGTEITSDFDSDTFAATIHNMEPGDELEYTITYKNGTDETTEWYMRNQVLETLEENKDPAENGGYTYILKNIGPDGTETVLFDNSEVGGEKVVDKLEGLKQATNATQDYFWVQQLGKNQSARTYLYVGFDGETEVNDYMDTYGKLLVSYAVEKKGTKKIYSHVDTGDRNRLLFLAVVNVTAVLLLIVALILRRREREECEEA